jgi:hypothetical protein
MRKPQNVLDEQLGIQHSIQLLGNFVHRIRAQRVAIFALGDAKRKHQAR